MKLLRQTAGVSVLLLIFSCFVFGTANVSGKLVNPNTTGPIIGGYAQFDLENCGGNYPQVAGASIASSQRFLLAADGSWSGVMYRNDEILCNGQATTDWRLTYFISSLQVGPQRKFVCSQSSCIFDGIGSLTPINVTPAPPAPQPPVTGSRTFLCSFINPASVWTCIHNMGTQFVDTEFFDSNFKLIVPDSVTATDVNTVTAIFLQPQAGYVLVINSGNFTPTVLNPVPIIQNPTSGQPIIGDFPLTVGGSLSAKRIESVRSADQFTGGDIGAQINAAYADLPSTGGVIVVPAKSDGTCWAFSTPIVFNVSGKYAVLRGGANTSQASGGSCLNYTPTTSTTAITFDITPVGGGAQAPGVGIRDIFLVNNGCIITGGCGSSATGIACGNTNGGCAQAYFQNVAVAGFSRGQTIGEPSGVGWGITWENATFIDNATGLKYLIPHENDKCIACSILLNGIGADLAAGAELSLIGGSVDSNTTCGINMTGNSLIHTSDIHWENLGTTNVQYVCGGPASIVDIKGGSASDDNNSGSTGQNWFTVGLGSTYGLIIFSGGRTYTSQIFSVQTRYRLDVINNSASIISPNTLCFLTNGACRLTESVNITNTQGYDLLGVSGYTELPTPAGFQISGVDDCYGDSTAHAIKCSYNAQAYGSVPLINLPWTWTGVQAFPSGTTVNGNAATQTIGSGTGTTAGTAIGAGTSQTLAITVTGASTSDVAACSTNASFPATWLTGITVLPPVVTSNTVTLTITNPTTGSITPAAQTFRCTVTR